MAVQSFSALVVENKRLLGDYIKVSFKPSCEVPYKAGQYLSVLVSTNGERRSYSIASYQGEENLELVIDTSPMGVGSKYFLGLKPNDQIQALGPLGTFCLSEKLGGKQLFVATGSGIVPLRSMIHDLLENQKYTGVVRLVWGMRFENEIFWDQEFKELAQKYPNFQYDLVISKPQTTWQGRTGHVGDILTSEKVNWSEWSAYVCGNQHMISDVSKLLGDLGIPLQEIYFEKFY